MNARFALASLGVALAAMAAPAAAHHSFAIYDMQQNVEFKGVVDTVKFRNPHMAMTLKVKDASGREKTVEFVEGALANMLARIGLRPEMIAPGTEITAIGALSHVVLNYFDWERKAYHNIPVAEQVEVASLIGDVAEGPDGKPALHAHIVVGRRDGSAMAGHLCEAHVRPTLEVILTESPAHLKKKMDPESGLALIRPAA